MKILNLVIIVFFLLTVDAFACDCGHPVGTDSEKAAHYLQNADAVFSGKVVGFEFRKDVRIPSGERRKETDPTISYRTGVVKVEVINWWKQAVPSFVYFRTHETKYSDGTSSESSCIFPYEFGKTYLFFGNEWEGSFITHDCSGSRELIKADTILPYLGAGQKPRPQK